MTPSFIRPGAYVWVVMPWWWDYEHSGHPVERRVVRLIGGPNHVIDICDENGIVERLLGYVPGFVHQHVHESQASARKADAYWIALSLIR